MFCGDELLIDDYYTALEKLVDDDQPESADIPEQKTDLRESGAQPKADQMETDSNDIPQQHKRADNTGAAANDDLRRQFNSPLGLSPRTADGDPKTHTAQNTGLRARLGPAHTSAAESSTDARGVLRRTGGRPFHLRPIVKPRRRGGRRTFRLGNMLLQNNDNCYVVCSDKGMRVSREPPIMACNEVYLQLLTELRQLLNKTLRNARHTHQGVSTFNLHLNTQNVNSAFLWLHRRRPAVFGFEYRLVRKRILKLELQMYTDEYIPLKLVDHSFAF